MSTSETVLLVSIQGIESHLIRGTGYGFFGMVWRLLVGFMVVMIRLWFDQERSENAYQ